MRKADEGWHLCVIYKALNQEEMNDKFLILVIDELLHELHGLVVFSKLDQRFGYLQIRVVSKNVHKMAFRTHESHCEFLMIPFGQTNALIHFSKVNK